MREVKFRAWGNVGIFGKAMGWISDVFIKDGVACTYKQGFGSGMGGGLDIIKYKNAAVMQFTGLQDKNGVDIYEGDILKDGPCVFTAPTIDEMITMAFDENSLGDIFSAELIGNIHQNPELIK